MKTRNLTNEERRGRHAQSFWRLVDIPDDADACWGWRGCMQGVYGSHRYGEAAPLKAHVVSYLIHHNLLPRDIPKDPTCRNQRMAVGHTCPQHTCCNPRHLMLVTHAQNQAENKRMPVRVSKEKVADIIQLFLTTDLTGAAVARRLDVRPLVVQSVLSGGCHNDVLPRIPRPITKQEAA